MTLAAENSGDDFTFHVKAALRNKNVIKLSTVFFLKNALLNLGHKML